MTSCVTSSTRLLIHLVDASSEDVLSDFKVVQQERRLRNGLTSGPAWWLSTKSCSWMKSWRSAFS